MWFTDDYEFYVVYFWIQFESYEFSSPSYRLLYNQIFGNIYSRSSRQCDNTFYIDEVAPDNREAFFVFETFVLNNHHLLFDGIIYITQIHSLLDSS